MKHYDHGMCTLCRTCGCCAEKERVIQKLEDALEAAVSEQSELVTRVTNSPISLAGPTPIGRMP